MSLSLLQPSVGVQNNELSVLTHQTFINIYKFHHWFHYIETKLLTVELIQINKSANLWVSSYYKPRENA